MSTGPFVNPDELDKPALTTGTDFDTMFKEKIKDFPKSMGIAVVDLTDGIPKYGVNSQEHLEKHVYSLAKIGPLLAAFRLQERLRKSFKHASVAEIEKAWKPLVLSAARDFHQEDFPKLDRIFTPPSSSGDWSFDFLETKPDWKTLQGHDDGPKDAIGGIKKPVIEKLGFLDRLKLSVRMSDDNAAGSVISDLGFSYIYATLVNEGFYSSKNHGLWIGTSYSLDYAGTVKHVESSGKDITVGATAFSVALYMTRLHRRKLVEESSLEMLDIMEEHPESGVGTDSRFTMGGGLAEGDVTFSKIGLDYDKASEGAVIEKVMKTKAGAQKSLKYVVVALQADHQSFMPKLAKKIDEYVQEVHFLDK